MKSCRLEMLARRNLPRVLDVLAQASAVVVVAPVQARRTPLLERARTSSSRLSRSVSALQVGQRTRVSKLLSVRRAAVDSRVRAAPRRRAASSVASASLRACGRPELRRARLGCSCRRAQRRSAVSRGCADDWFDVCSATRTSMRGLAACAREWNCGSFAHRSILGSIANVVSPVQAVESPPRRS